MKTNFKPNIAHLLNQHHISIAILILHQYKIIISPTLDQEVQQVHFFNVSTQSNQQDYLFINNTLVISV